MSEVVAESRPQRRRREKAKAKARQYIKSGFARNLRINPGAPASRETIGERAAVLDAVIGAA